MGMRRKNIEKRLPSGWRNCGGSIRSVRGRIVAGRNRGGLHSYNLDLETEVRQMARGRSKRKKRSAKIGEIPQMGLATAGSAAPEMSKPVRGLKLRTVSLLTMAFALACL